MKINVPSFILVAPCCFLIRHLHRQMEPFTIVFFNQWNRIQVAFRSSDFMRDTGNIFGICFWPSVRRSLADYKCGYSKRKVGGPYLWQTISQLRLPVYQTMMFSMTKSWHRTILFRFRAWLKLIKWLDLYVMIFYTKKAKKTAKSYSKHIIHIIYFVTRFGKICYRH